MRTFLWVVVGINELFILLIGAVHLSKYERTDFALKTELAGRGSQTARLRRQLHKLLPEVRMLQRVELVIAASALVGLLSHLNKPVLGVIYALLSFLVISLLARIRQIQKLAEKLFEATLGVVIRTTLVLQPLWVVLGVKKSSGPALPDSEAEFVDMLKRLPSSVIESNQRKRLEAVLDSETKIVKDIMTPKKQVIGVEPSATLGPILLSDLQKSGHGYFPVGTKQGEPEGILALGDLADIQAAKQRSSVRELMSEQVAWVEESTSLYELADAFLQEKQYLILVRNLNGDYSGIVTIADLMKNLLGIVKD